MTNQVHGIPVPKEEGGVAASPPGCQPSASAPLCGGSSQSDIPNALRLKLDRRIHRQRLALRQNWEIVEQRRRGMRSFSLDLIRSAKQLCDLLGIPEGPADGLGRYALLYRMKLAASAAGARSAETEGLGPEDARAASEAGDAQPQSSHSTPTKGHNNG